MNGRYLYIAKEKEAHKNIIRLKPNQFIRLFHKCDTTCTPVSPDTVGIKTEIDILNSTTYGSYFFEFRYHSNVPFTSNSNHMGTKHWSVPQVIKLVLPELITGILLVNL